MSLKVMKRIVFAALMILMVCVMGMAAAETVTIAWPFVLNGAAPSSYSIRYSGDIPGQYNTDVNVTAGTGITDVTVEKKKSKITFSASEEAYNQFITVAAKNSAGEEYVVHYQLQPTVVFKGVNVNAASGAALTKVDRGVYELRVKEGDSVTVTINHELLGGGVPDMTYSWKFLGQTQPSTTNSLTFTAAADHNGKTLSAHAVNNHNPSDSNFDNLIFPVVVEAAKPTPTPGVKVEVEDQTEEQKQNNTVTVVVPDTTIEEVIASTTSNVVELPVEHAPVDKQTAVTTAKVSEEAFEKLANTNKAVSVPLDHAEVIIQPSVVEQIAEKAAAGSEIEICVEQKKPQEALNTVQLQSLSNQKVAAVITADVFMKQGDNRTKINFQADQDEPVTLKVPFTPPAGESGHDYVIVYVADNGQIETLTTYYTNGYFVFETYHFSDFVITARTVDTNANTSVPKTGDNSTPIVWLFGMLIATAGCAAILGKRHQNG